MGIIEQLIHQEKFKDDKQKAIISVLYAANMIKSHHETFFRSHGITCQQYNALRILRGQYPEPCKVSVIRERLIDKMSDTSRIVERLRKSGYVQRVTSKADKRAVDVVLTAKGLQLLRKIDKHEKEIHKSTKPISDKEAQQLNAILDKMLNELT